MSACAFPQLAFKIGGGDRLARDECYMMDLLRGPGGALTLSRPQEPPPPEDPEELQKGDEEEEEEDDDDD
jgi:hypothetical protein